MKNSQLLPKLRKLAAFAFAGGIGFLVDIGVLRLMLQTFDITPFTARIPAIIAAMSTTWMINRTLTFGVSGRSLHQEGGRYFAVALIGVTLNYLIYSLILIDCCPAGVSARAGGGNRSCLRDNLFLSRLFALCV